MAKATETVSKFFKEHRFKIILGLSLLILIFFALPAQEKHYPREELKIIKQDSTKVLLGVIVLGGLALLFYGSRQLANLKELGNLVFGVLFICLSSFLFFKPAMQSVFLLLNSVATDRVYESYTVFLPYGREATPMLYNRVANKWITGWETQRIDKAIKLDSGDVVTVVSKKGLLGYRYDLWIE